MANLTLRSTKGSALTNEELDGNFEYFTGSYMSASHSPGAFTFDPIYKERIWGGNRLKTLFDKKIPSNRIGESWEISSLPEDVSVINNGIYKGKTLNEIIIVYVYYWNLSILS
jgi:hypothetical protein